MPELELDLTRAGADEHEAAELAALLERAAGPARFEVSDAEIDAALQRARPQRAPMRLPRLVFATAALAVVALAVVLVIPRGQENVQARALDALGGRNSVLYLRLEVFSRLQGSQGTSIREEWFDAARMRARWTQYGEFGGPVSETLVEPGRFVRYVGTAGLRLVGTSCRAFASGCAELVDPVSRYRAELARTRGKPVRTTFEGRPAYRFQLPLQGRIDQLVYVDTETFLPRTIIWREREGGNISVVATISLSDVETYPRTTASTRDAFTLPSGGRIVRVEPAGRKLGERQLTLRQARAARAFWLGSRGLTGIHELRYANGRTIRMDYGTTEVWTVGRSLPGDLLASRLAETKTFVYGGRLVTVFSNGSRLIVVRDGSPTLVLVAREAAKEGLLGLAGQVRRLR